ncbi:unnamed protein product [Diatraea saccharalis]|uniref:Uncharacterized protein n=1 Tax=Diatraea saccharalis TaxID=40085 RepID=A0A9N9RD19_9NEOP|nr:unnamed protein product [Diatraea saccharalis]
MSPFLALVLVAFVRNGAAYDEYQDLEDDQSIDADFDDQYESEGEDIIMTMTRTTSADPDTRFRIKRFGDHSSGARTLSQDEIRDVKGALKELLAGHQLDRLTAYTTEITTNDVFSINEDSTKDFTFTSITQKIEFLDATEFYNDVIEEIIDNAKRQGLLRTVTLNDRKTGTSTIFKRETSETEYTQLTYSIVKKPERTPEISFVPEKGRDFPKASQAIFQGWPQTTEDKFEVTEDIPNMDKKYPDIFRDFTGMHQEIPEWIKNFPREGQIVLNRSRGTFSDDDKIEDVTGDDNMSIKKITIIFNDEMTESDEENNGNKQPMYSRKFGFTREGKNESEDAVTSASNIEVASASASVVEVTSASASDVEVTSVSDIEVTNKGAVEVTSVSNAEVAVEVTSASDGEVTNKGAVEVTSVSDGEVAVEFTSLSGSGVTNEGAVEVMSASEGAATDNVAVGITSASDVEVTTANEGERQGDDDDDDEEQNMFKRTTTSTTTTTMRTLKMADPHYYPYPYSSMLYPETTTKPNTTTTLWRTRRRKTTTPTITTSQIPQIDIPRLVEIIANLTNDFESNITDMFNKTLQKYNIPTCPSNEITEPPIYYELANATVVAKCFVCGLNEPQIPIDSFCSDAFAIDFIPLVPLNPQSRGRIARYRRYCRYLDVDNFYENATEPRSVFGRFTGGCSVRWIDISSVYTQRACRNRRHAVIGRHFGSKRMAKLEMALHVSSTLAVSRGLLLHMKFFYHFK